jgi:hypothetical protein
MIHLNKKGKEGNMKKKWGMGSCKQEVGDMGENATQHGSHSLLG